MPEIGVPHKLTHQEGGNDELDLTGMAPGAHKTSHQNAGSDEITVLGLSGLLADSQNPLGHKTRHQDGGSDEISVAGLAGRQIFVPFLDVIGNINEHDTDIHFMNLATALNETRKIIMVLLRADRVSGTGDLETYPNEGAIGWLTVILWIVQNIVIKDGSQRLQYRQTVANDSLDVRCCGYVVET